MKEHAENNSTLYDESPTRLAIECCKVLNCSVVHCKRQPGSLVVYGEVAQLEVAQLVFFAIIVLVSASVPCSNILLGQIAFLSSTTFER